MSLGIVVKVITRGVQQLSMSCAIWFWFCWKVRLLVAKPVPGFCYCNGNHKPTIPQPVPGCRQSILNPAIVWMKDILKKQDGKDKTRFNTPPGKSCLLSTVRVCLQGHLYLKPACRQDNLCTIHNMSYYLRTSDVPYMICPIISGHLMYRTVFVLYLPKNKNND